MSGALSDVASIAGPVLGGVVGSSASSDAANEQTQAEEQAAQIQQNEFNQIQGQLEPWMTSGQDANTLLEAFLGVPMQTQSEQQIYNALAPQYTTQQAVSPQSAPTNPDGTTNYAMTSLQQRAQAVPRNPDGSPNFNAMTPQQIEEWYDGAGQGGETVSVSNGTNTNQVSLAQLNQMMNPTPQTQSVVNTAGLNAAVQNALAQQNALSSEASSIQGMALKPFTYNEASDPMAQTMLQMGSQAIANQRSALGGVNSGATLQALSDYGQQTAASSYEDEFNNYYTGLNAIYNMLMGVSNSGQNAAAGLGNAGMSTANSLASDATAAGVASSAGTVGSANALSGALSGVSQGLLNNAYLNNGSSGATNGLSGIDISGTNLDLGGLLGSSFNASGTPSWA